MKPQTISINASQIKRRRVKIFGITLLCTLISTLKWMEVIPSDASWFTSVLMIVLFVLTFGWISLFFWSSIFGFCELLKGKNVPGIIWPDDNSSISTKTAILMPIYNENPLEVFSNLAAIAQSLKLTGQQQNYDMFVLSDTTNPDLWIKEEAVWLATKENMPEGMNLYYRRRAQNTARKSGNIEDFCSKWGALYDFMVVLDADSLLAGKTIVTMTKLMQANEATGIIQAPPMCINKNSLFARVQQFAGKVYGPIVSAGLAYWQLGDSNYWGHNAIIRTKAFMDCCKLPVLKGKAPFGGPILSHDFVEAALIRRGGWNAWLLPELTESYEECPPTLIDFALRDRRWCQGNMQHLKIVTAKGLNPISRVHFTIGIMSYLSSPLWLCFLLVGLSVALGRNFFPPEYFPKSYTLFPTWPIFDKIGIISMFAFSIFMLIFPKFLGLVVYLKQNKSSTIGGYWGAIKSVVAEIIFSALSAPIMMLFQSKFVWDIFTGHDSGWKSQNRDDTGTPWTIAWQRHKWHTLLGIVTAVVVWKYANGLFWWMSPITVGLILSIPFSFLSSKEKLGLWAKRHNYFVIPEEVNKPEVLQKAHEYLLFLEKNHLDDIDVKNVITDNELNALHILMLPVNGPAPDYKRSDLKNAEIKLENFIRYNLEPVFTKDEAFAVLYNENSLKNANLMYNLEHK